MVAWGWRWCGRGGWEGLKEGIIRGNEEAGGGSGYAHYLHPGEGSAGVSRCGNSSDCSL